MQPSTESPRAASASPVPDLRRRVNARMGEVALLGVQSPTDRRMAAALLATGRMTAEQIKLAAARPEPLLDAATALGLLAAGHVVEVRAAAAGLEFVDLQKVRITTDLLTLLPAEIAQRYRAIPFAYDADIETVFIALASADDAVAQQVVQQYLASKSKKASFAVGAEDQINQYATRYTGLDDLMQAAIDEQNAADEPVERVGQSVAEQLVDSLITEAVRRGASDLHFEGGQNGRGMAVRYRIDGVMHFAQDIPETHRMPVISVLKLLMDLDISEKRRTQSGRASCIYGGRRVDLRGETIPVVYGNDMEDIVIRVLDQEGLELDLSAMGWSEVNKVRYERGYRRPQGAVLLTGPTGHGKSSTLYATLLDLPREDIKVWTIENPVEYQVEGVRQMQVDTKVKGRDFLSLLRTAMRADPDVVMVGEIRDRETAETAMSAAQTGHLMFTTLHTNDACSAVARLRELGVPVHVIADSLTCVVAQRLMRTLCTSCREPHVPTQPELMSFGYDAEQAQEVINRLSHYELHRANREGCRFCTGGYKGRTAVHEVLLIGPEERAVLLDDRKSGVDLERAAIANGMVPLKDDALTKAFAGQTSLDEIRRVITSTTQ